MRDVVGRSDNAQAQHAFRWISPGPLQDIHAFYFSPHVYSEARGINSSDFVVGWAQDGYIKDAFFWTPAFGAMILSDLGGATTIAHDINDAGVIVGQAQGMVNGTPFGSYYATKWTANGVTLLSAPGIFDNVAHAINKNEYVVGMTEALGPTLWKPNAKSFALGHLPGGSHSVARDVNKHLEIVGHGLGPDNFMHAIYWKVTFYSYTLSALAPWAQPHYPPPITLGAKGTIDVAILSSPRLDASRLDPALFTLGDFRDADSPVARDARGVPLASRGDVDKDGRHRSGASLRSAGPRTQRRSDACNDGTDHRR